MALYKLYYLQSKMLYSRSHKYASSQYKATSVLTDMLFFDSS